MRGPLRGIPCSCSQVEYHGLVPSPSSSTARPRPFPLFLTLVGVLFTCSAEAAVLEVDPEAGPYVDIPSALAVAVEGDEIVVAPGTYSGPFDLAFGDPTVSDDSDLGFAYPPVTLRSREGAWVTTLDNGGSFFAVRLRPGSVLWGFSIGGNGDGVRAVGGTTAEDVFTIAHNDIGNTGGTGIRIQGGGLSRVEANYIRGPSSTGISVAGEAEVVANLVIGIEGEGIRLGAGGGSARNNALCDVGIGLSTQGAFVGEILNNTVVFSATGVSISDMSYPLRLKNNTVAWSGVGMDCGALSAETLGYNNRWDLDSLGACAAQSEDLFIDPQFVELDVGNRRCEGMDLHLQPRSELVDAGTPEVLDADGSLSDVGAFGGPDSPAWDFDEDGVPAGEDCDDRDGRAAPDQTEICSDGIDNDCDLDIDDRFTECFTPGPDLEGLYCGSAGRQGSPWLLLVWGASAFRRRRAGRRNP